MKKGNPPNETMHSNVTQDSNPIVNMNSSIQNISSHAIMLSTYATVCAHTCELYEQVYSLVYVLSDSRNAWHRMAWNRSNRLRRRSWNGPRRVEIVSLHQQYNCLPMCRGYFPKNNSFWRIKLFMASEDFM